MLLDARNIGQTIRLIGTEEDPTEILEGVLTDVKISNDTAWDQLLIGGKWVYVSDWLSSDVIERDGKRLPTEEGVYKIISEVMTDTFVQLDNEGQWWPYPYSFSGWRNSELLVYPGLEVQPELTVDYPAIKNPEEAEIYRRDMALKARIWDEGYQANRQGTQAFRNPYKICEACNGVAGNHDQVKHDALSEQWEKDNASN